MDRIKVHNITDLLDYKTMTRDGTQKLKAGATENMGTVGTVTQTP